MATSNFDFNEYNKIIRQANSGLKLFLAEQLLADVNSTMVRFRNPLAKELTDIVDEVINLRKLSKKQVEARANAGNTADIDNAGVPSDTPKPVADYTNKHGDKPADHKEQPATE